MNTNTTDKLCCMFSTQSEPMETLTKSTHRRFNVNLHTHIIHIHINNFIRRDSLSLFICQGIDFIVCL